MKPTDYYCDRCQAQPGDPCRTLNSNRATKPHAARVKLARATEAPPAVAAPYRAQHTGRPAPGQGKTRETPRRVIPVSSLPSKRADVTAGMSWWELTSQDWAPRDPRSRWGYLIGGMLLAAAVLLLVLAWLGDADATNGALGLMVAVLTLGGTLSLSYGAWHDQL